MGDVVKLNVIHTENYDPLNYYLQAALDVFLEHGISDDLLWNMLYIKVLEAHALYETLREDEDQNE